MNTAQGVLQKKIVPGAKSALSNVKLLLGLVKVRYVRYGGV
jgi:hypothetical protein